MPPKPDRLISFVCENDADLLPHFVRWYRGLGVEHFHFILHGRWSAAGLATLEGLGGVDFSRRVDEPFCKTLKCDEITACARRFPGEWVVLADADEFLQLPTDSLAEAAARLEAAGADELYANMLQRVAADGSLPEVTADARLEELFPLFSFGLCEEMGLEHPAWKSKYPLARIGPHFTYQRGNHLPGNSRSVAHVPIRGVVHHFKWRRRLLEAFSQERGEGTNFAEMAVYRRYINTHGRLPTALAKPCTTETLFEEGWLRLPNDHESAILRRMVEERAAATAAGIRVGFVTFELGGPGTTNGGIATAMSALAKLQAAHGHRVDLFYCPFHGPPELPRLWFEYWATFGASLHYLPRYDTAWNRELESNELCAAILHSVQEQGHFDVLHFHDTQGYAAPFAMLKRAGLGFERTKLVITTHGGTRWHNEPNGTPWKEAEYNHELIGQRLCDLIVSPSGYMIEWNQRLDAAGSRHIVLPNVLEPESKAATGRPPRRVVPQCLAFFGRVERRKGIDLFIAALRELSSRTSLRPEVYILGRFGTGYSRERLDSELEGIDCTVHLLQSLNPQQALRLMREKKALAIMPSRQENSPYVAFEAMENQLPFLVSFTGGTAELIHPDDLSQAELPADPADMAESIRRAMVDGLRPARPRFDPLEIELKHLELWRSLAAEPDPAVPPPTPVHRCPLTGWEAASGRDPRDVIALVPPGVEVSENDLQSLGKLLVSSPLVDLVQSSCRLVDEKKGFSMSSLRLERLDPEVRLRLTGPLPTLLRAGLLAELRPALDGETPETLLGALPSAAAAAGRNCVRPPIETHSRRLSLALEDRTTCSRLGMRFPDAGSVAPSHGRPLDSDMLCGLLHADPYVALSMIQPHCPHGALSLLPDAFRGRPSLHLVTIGESVLGECDWLRERLEEARAIWPEAHLCVLAADEAELAALRAARVPALLGNLNMFTDERVFHPFRAAARRRTMDAIYVAPMVISKNHFLARDLGRVGISYYRHAGMDDVEPQVRSLLEGAVFLNESRFRPAGYFWPSDRRLANWICQADVGLALSERDGTCVETAKYLLCGTPVVSVRNVGGRDHFLKSPYSIQAETNPESVAAAVRELKARRLPRVEVHEAAKRVFVEARAAFLSDLNDLVRDLFGSAHRIPDVSGLIGRAVRYRRAAGVLAPSGSGRRRWFRMPGIAG